jgi:hypothetical protein
VVSERFYDPAALRDFEPTNDRNGPKPGITAAQHGRPLYLEELILSPGFSPSGKKKFSNFADMRVCLPRGSGHDHPEIQTPLAPRTVDKVRLNLEKFV